MNVYVFYIRINMRKPTKEHEPLLTKLSFSSSWHWLYKDINSIYRNIIYIICVRYRQIVG